MKIIGIIIFSILALIVSGQTSEQYFSNLTAYEGFTLFPYRDAKNTISVGVGHNLTAHGEVAKDIYSIEEVMGFFHKDLDNALVTARRYITNFDCLPVNAKLVTVNIIWGVGNHGFSKFKEFHFALSHRCYPMAIEELRNSLWARQVQKSRVDSNCDLLLRSSDSYLF